MKIAAAVGTAILIALAVVLGASSERPSDVQVVQLSEATWDEFAPQGKEVDAIYGDYVVRNQFLTAVIAQPLASRHANMTVRDVAGALIDMTIRDAQSDQLSAFYPERRKYPFRSAAVTTGDGKPVELKGTAAYSAKEAAVVVRAEAAENRPAVEVTYRLAADARHLTVTTKYTNTGDKPLSVSLEDDLRADAGKEQMPKAPNGVADLFWVHDQYWDQAYGVDSPQRQVQSNSNARESVLKYVSATEPDAITLEPGKSYEWSRRIFPAANLVDVKAIAGELRGRSSHPARLMLVDGAGGPIPNARVEVSTAPSVIGSANTDSRGLLACRLAEGNYALKVSALGVAVGGDDGKLTFQVANRPEPQPFRFELNGYRPGVVKANITDANGAPIPCKVEFIAKGQTTQPNFGPETADFAVGNLHYAPSGHFTQQLPAGEYDVIISRGPEYDAIFTELTVPPGKTVPLTGRLVRSVKTPGWVSSDFHSHSSPSGDNTGSQLGRVVNLVCEHISGGLRNWIQSPTDEPAEINAMDMVHAAEQGRLIMSNGPYLEVSLSETGGDTRVTAGQEIAAPSGKVSVQVRVQCAMLMRLCSVHGATTPARNTLTASVTAW